jgi:exonuclease III
VRGLNSRARRDVVRELVAAEKPSIVCLQETKMHVISIFDVMQFLGAGFDYTYLLSSGTHGGILVAWKAACWSVTSTVTLRCSVSVKLRHASGGGGGGLVAHCGLWADE